MKNAIAVRPEESPAFEVNSEEDKTSLLEIENELLKEKLGLSDFCSYFAKNMNPLSLNRFLKHILFMEDIGPQKSIRSLFPPDTTFPPVEDMGETELTRRVEFLEDVLSDNGILLELSPALPPAETYKYIVEEMLSEFIPCSIPERGAIHFTGCGGWCPDCFQKEYCETRKELWPDL